MALQTREQHIRRDKASSNICTAQALLAIMGSFYTVYHGPAGIKKIGTRIHSLSALLAKALQELEYSIENSTYFDTLSVNVGGLVEATHAEALNQELNFHYNDKV